MTDEDRSTDLTQGHIVRLAEGRDRVGTKAKALVLVRALPRSGWQAHTGVLTVID